MATRKQLISVVVPVYNEHENIGQFHTKLISSLQKTMLLYEVIYIDDNSQDGTFDILTTLGKQHDSRKDMHGVVKVLRKVGKQGKAYSLVEGFASATGNILVMLDGDLQYPPSAIPEMVKKLRTVDIVVAQRKEYQGSFLRKTLSKSFKFFFGKMLFGLDTDVQSGLKAFRREVYNTAKFTPRSPWTFDLEFIHRAVQAGFSVENFPITFAPRQDGSSKIHLVRQSLEIGFNALQVKVLKRGYFVIPPTERQAMIGAGVGYRKQKYITHTTLPVTRSAIITFSLSQKFFIGILLLSVLFGLIFRPLLTAQVVVGVLSIFYFVDTVFNIVLVLRSLQKAEEITINKKELHALSDADLPVYTILCPLYKEAHVVSQFLKALKQLEWPKEKLDVMLLLEEDDWETVAAIKQMELPSYVRFVIVPNSYPKTKPKACNYGLAYAKGEFLVIYDAEDIPDPKQLKKAYLGFQKVPENVQCLQAKLNYYNARQNMLTRFFTAEYSLWFDLTLTGLQSLNSTIPLGGTSNHFRTKTLRDLQGWDPFNVTEDADLGLRLFQKGYRTAIVDSTTYEEANSMFKNWLRQRSRWIKGYMQTYLVHMRHASTFIKEKGLWHHIVFQLTIGGKLLFILLNPFMWIITFLYFAFFPLVGPTIESIYVPPISYLAVVSWIFGNFLFFYCYMIGIAKRQQWDIMKYTLYIPFYWLMMSVAAVIAFYQLITKPHYWEKTVHGFHLGSKEQEAADVSAKRSAFIPVPAYAENGYRVKGGVATYDRKKQTASALRAKFFSILFQTVSFMLLLFVDVLLARAYLPEQEFHTYLLLSAVGKTMFIVSQFIGSAVGSFIDKRRSSSRLYTLIFYTFIFNWISFVTFGIKAQATVPLFLQGILAPAIPYLPLYLFAFLCFGIAYTFVTFHLEKKTYSFALVSFVVISLQAMFAAAAYDSIDTLVRTLAYLGVVDLVAMIALQILSESITVFENNVFSLFGLFKKVSSEEASSGKSMRILFFNWRDTKHIYSGGAEVYIQELAKRWVQDGNKVTIFCGNDNRNKANEIIDGVEIIRRGGFYTVYFFAIMYYAFKLRGKFDVIIDCENGIPFFTPLFVRKPIVLLLHHVHQEVFRAFLRYPLDHIAQLLEGKLMPLVYRNKHIITVSQSSKKEIVKLGFTRSKNIEIIHGGVSQAKYFGFPKTPYPSFVYLGRLKDYKNIDIAIKAFAIVVRNHKHARFAIAGSGESLPALKALAARLGIEKHMDFLGRVTEEKKGKLLAESWVALQPSQIEGWGITVIEANAAGTPVIASEVNGLKDSVIDGKTGVLIEPRNVEQLALEMDALITDNTYRKFLSKSARIWSRQFDWNKSAEYFYDSIVRSLRPKKSHSSFTDGFLDSEIPGTASTTSF